MKIDASLLAIYNKTLNQFDKYLNWLSKESNLSLKKDNNVILEGKLEFWIHKGIGSKFGPHDTPKFYDELVVSDGKKMINIRMPNNISDGELNNYYLSNYKRKYIPEDPYGEEDWEANENKIMKVNEMDWVEEDWDEYITEQMRMFDDDEN